MKIYTERINSRITEEKERINSLRCRMVETLLRNRTKKNELKVMGREEGGGFGMGNTCIPVADSF